MTHPVWFQAGDVVSMRNGTKLLVVRLEQGFNARPSNPILAYGMNGAPPVWIPADRLALTRRNASPPKPKRIGDIMEHGQ